MFYGRYGTTKQITDTFRVIIFARENNPKHNTIIQQLDTCQNFAQFFDYKIVGVATEIETLFNTDIEYDGVILTKRDRLSRNAVEYKKIKQELLKQEKIIIPAVRSN